jgi:hypothetical protein
VLVSLSSYFFLKKERHRLSKKNIWTHEGPSIEKKEKNIWTHEGPSKKKKKKDSHALKKNLYRERDHTKGVSISSTTIHTRAHVDLIV